MESETDRNVSMFGSQSISQESLTPYSDATKCKRVTAHTRKPMNSFMVFSQVERRKLVCRAVSHVPQRTIIKWLGKRWNCLSAEKKQVYADEAERLRLLHRKEYPDYYKRPQGVNSKRSVSAAVKVNGPSKKSESEPRRQITGTAGGIEPPPPPPPHNMSSSPPWTDSLATQGPAIPDQDHVPNPDSPESSHQDKLTDLSISPLHVMPQRPPIDGTLAALDCITDVIQLPSGWGGLDILELVNLMNVDLSEDTEQINLDLARD